MLYALARSSHRSEDVTTSYQATHGDVIYHHGHLLVKMSSWDLGNCLLFRSLRNVEETLKEAFSENFEGPHNNATTWSWELPRLLSTIRKSKEIISKMFEKLPTGRKNSINETIGDIVTARNRLAHSGKYSLSDVLRGVKAAHRLVAHLSKSTALSENVLDQLKTSINAIQVAKTQSQEKLGGVETAGIHFRTLLNKSNTVQTSRLVLTTTNLIGREDDLGECVSFLKKVRGVSYNCAHGRLVLFGPHGIGKTALARAILRNVQTEYPHQYFFQASSIESFHASCNAFLENEATSIDQIAAQSPERSFSNFLESTRKYFLFVFDDVSRPELVLQVLPMKKHCVVFTSADEVNWDNSLRILTLSENTYVMKMKPITTHAAVALFKEVMSKNGGSRTFDSLARSPEGRSTLGGILQLQMGNVPLAVRLCAFQFLSGSLSSLDDFRNVADPAPPSRTQEDEQSAGRVHIRGFYYVVRKSVNKLLENKVATSLCYALSLLSPSGVPISYIDLLVLELRGLREIEKNLTIGSRGKCSEVDFA